MKYRIMLFFIRFTLIIDWNLYFLLYFQGIYNSIVGISQKCALVFLPFTCNTRECAFLRVHMERDRKACFNVLEQFSVCNFCF